MPTHPDKDLPNGMPIQPLTGPTRTVTNHDPTLIGPKPENPIRKLLQTNCWRPRKGEVLNGTLEIEGC